MRIPNFPAIVRTFYTFTNYTTRINPIQYRAVHPFTRGTVLRSSIPGIPFIGSFFSSQSSSQNMSYPLKKSDDEWQAVLSKGKLPSVLYAIIEFKLTTVLQSNSAS